MKEYDFSDCEFIHNMMRYYTYLDFCKDKETIKKWYNTMSDNGKRFYMWYVYANIHMDLKFKNAIWDYLNGYDKDGKTLIQLATIYKIK